MRRIALTKPSLRSLALAAFPVVVWLMATFALGGDIGRSTDDYAADLRDPATGSAAGFNPFHEYNYFWRPAHLVLIYGLQTFFGDHGAALHALGTLAHGAVALLVFLVARRITAAPLASASAAALFMVHPIHYEAIFFTSTLSTLIACALALAVALTFADWAGNPGPERRWRPLAGMAAMALATPLFYEQPAAALAALPLLGLAATAGNPTAAGTAPRLRRIAAGAVLLVATQVPIVLAIILTAPASRRGSAGSLVGLSDLPARAAACIKGLARGIGGLPARQVARGGFDLGRDVLTGTPLWVWLVPLGLTCAACWLALAPTRCRTSIAPAYTNKQEQPRRSARASLWLIAYGLGFALASLLPAMLVTGQQIAPRMTYTPLVGLALACAGVLACLSAAAPERLRAWGPVALFPAAAVLMICGAVALVGMQEQWRRRSQADAQIARALARLAPSPPPGTIFVPLAIEHTPTRTGMLHFDRSRPGAYEAIWSATALTRQTFRRADVFAAGWSPWRSPQLTDPTDATVRLTDRFVIDAPFEHDARGGTIIPIDRLIPFVVGPGGRTRLVRRLSLPGDDGRTMVITPPLVAELLDRGAVRPGETAVWH